MKERRSDRYVSIALSVLIHGAIIGALVFGVWRFRNPTPAPQTLAIDATVVRSQSATAAPAAPPTPAPAPAPQPTPPPETPPPTPQPDAAEQARKDEQERKAEQDRKAEQQRQADEARAEQERQQKEREDAQRKAREEADRAAKAEAERKAKEEAERKAKADAERRAQEVAQQAARAQRESDLQSQLAVEEHLNAARASGEQTQYIRLLEARIERAWIRPPSAHSGINCEVHVTQVPGGAVTGVQIGSCNGDDSVRQSIEAAVYRASPLPPPPDPALFDRNLIVNFRPSD